MKFIDNNHSQMLGQAMDAYSLRQKITSSNIANADTPDYKRHEVHFEQELQKAQKAGGTNVTASIHKTDDNVLLENEMIEMADTQIRVQLVARSFRHHFDLLRNGITGINR